MSLMRRWLVPAVMATAVVACATLSAGAQKLSGDELLVYNYSLTMAKVDAYVKANLAMYREMEKMSAAERAAWERRAEKEEEESESVDDKGIAETARELEAIPQMRKALAAAGITATELMTFTLVMFQVGMMDWILEQDKNAKLPHNVNPANVRFYRTNKAAIEEKMKPVKALMEADEKKRKKAEQPDEEPASDTLP